MSQCRWRRESEKLLAAATAVKRCFSIAMRRLIRQMKEEDESALSCDKRSIRRRWLGQIATQTSLVRSEALQLQKCCGTIIGELNPHYSKLIRVLQDGERMELQALFIPSLSRHAIPCQAGKRGRKVEKL